MANDRNKDSERNRDQEQHDAQKRDRTFGAGMDSPDSTEAVLDASTGLPDPRARGQRGSAGQQADGSDAEEEA